MNLRNPLVNMLIGAVVAASFAVPVLVSDPTILGADIVTTTTTPKPPIQVAPRATAPTTAAPGLPTLVTTPAGMCPQEDSCRIDYRSDGRWYIYPAAH